MGMNAAWEDYRRRFRQLLVAWPGGFALVILFMAVADSLPSRLAGFLTVVLPCSWMLAFAVTSLRLYGFRCPRCNKAFFHTCWYNNLYARRCVHCGLPKWGDGACEKPSKKASDEPDDLIA